MDTMSRQVWLQTCAIHARMDGIETVLDNLPPKCPRKAYELHREYHGLVDLLGDLADEFAYFQGYDPDSEAGQILVDAVIETRQYEHAIDRLARLE